MIASRLARRAGRALTDTGRRRLVAARTRGWEPFSRLFVVGDRGGWSIDDDAAELTATAGRLGLEVAPPEWARFACRQAVFCPSHFQLLRPVWLESTHRLGLAYLHGRPGTPGEPAFDVAFDALRSHPDRVGAVQVTHAEMHELVLAAGVDPAKVFRIPIGIDIERFPPGDPAARASARRELDLPASAFVVGSFQKDGVGWGAGLEPKLIKGPDAFVAAVERARSAGPELVVLLTGPARGYVRRELDRRGVPYRHALVDSRSALARAYHALDVYLVASRQEGGPKSLLESLATGVPFVSTRVGQTAEIVADGRSGLLADVDDVEALAAAVVRVRDEHGLAETLRLAGRDRARELPYRRLDGRWAALLETLVGRAG
jgi:glycosyltransferase involved in cell wall biosynthesis